MEIVEIFKSIEGETTYIGLPCIFVRFGRCDLSCAFCDTEYAKTDFKEMSVEEVIEEVEKLNSSLVCLTGGEPLLQDDLLQLIEVLANRKYTILVETNGANLIKVLPETVIVILDLKCPGSGMTDKILWENIKYISQKDEIKFVISSKNDFDWSLEVIRKFELVNKSKILMSPVFGLLEPLVLAKWILESGENIRLNLQIHKYIWGADTKGV